MYYIKNCIYNQTEMTVTFSSRLVRACMYLDIAVVDVVVCWFVSPFQNSGAKITHVSFCRQIDDEIR